MNQDSCIAAEKAWIEIQDNVKGISISVLRILASLLTEVRFYITTENGGQRIEIFGSPLRVYESRCMLSAWIEILASLLRMCESRFRHLPLKMKSKILVFIWDSKISYSHLAVENMNWHSHGPTEKGWLVIPMLLKIDVFSVDLRIMTKRSAPTPLALIARMSQPLPSDLSAVQITQLVSKASKERSNLDDLLIQKLSAFQECETALSAAKKGGPNSSENWDSSAGDGKRLAKPGWSD